MKSGTSQSAEIRARLKHPIIDSDGHVAEFEPAFFDFLKATAGAEMVEKFKSLGDSPYFFRWYRLTPAQRRDLRAPRLQWWVHPTLQTLYRATSSLPKLLQEPRVEMVLVFTIPSRTRALFMPPRAKEEGPPACCPAYTDMPAQFFPASSERMPPAAIIPVHTPREAIAEL